MASNDGQASRPVETADDSSLHRTQASTAFVPVKDKTALQDAVGQGSGGESSITLTRTSNPTASKMDFLPRLRRQGQLEALQAAAGPSTPSMAQRLERMRIEDRRRKRNEERRDALRRGQPTHGSGPAPSPTPGLASSASASSRAGALYFSSERLARQDALEAQRKRTIRQTFAGPAPPSSWMGATPAKEDTEDPTPSSDRQIQASPMVDRRRVLTAVRHFFADHNDTSRGSMTLADHCLCAIYDHFSSKRNDSYNFTGHAEDLHAIPSHLKERLLALCGRLALTEPMRESFLADLFCKHAYSDDNGADKGSTEGPMPDAHQDSTETDDFDDWDASSEENGPSWSLADGCSTIDLSFASVSTREISDLIFSTDLRASHIRKLSLAGWGNTSSSVAAGQGSANKCLRASTRLLNVLDQLVNLQVLSLAASRLLPNEGHGDADAEDGPVTSIDVTSEAIAFLKKLARRTSRLTLLDLSFNRWLDGAVLANLGWYSLTVPVRRLMWPKLEQLVLVGCPAFSPATASLTSTDIVTFDESPGFSASWHAAHHGMRQSTDSVYFLHHKPGLGRALLADGYRAWEHVGRHGLVGREAAALSLHSGLAGTSTAANARLARRQARTLEGQGPSAFDDDDADNTVIGDRIGLAGRNGYRPNPTPPAGFAISHGVAPFARPSAHFGEGPRSERADPTHPNGSSSSVPRCPVSRKQVTQMEWERARVLDAVRGRWGSAVLGTIDDENHSDDAKRTGEGHGSTKRRLGVFTSVYF